MPSTLKQIIGMQCIADKMSKKDGSLKALCPPNPGAKWPKSSGGVSVDLHKKCNTNTLQKIMKENDPIVNHKHDGNEYFLVAISQAYGGPAVSKKFALAYNANLEKAQSVAPRAEKIFTRKRIEINNNDRLDCYHLPDDCPRHDPILIKTFQSLKKGEIDAGVIPGIPASNWNLVLIPLENRYSFEITTYDGLEEILISQ